MPEEKELREKLEDVKKKLMVMEWDQSHNQLNAGKFGMFNELKEQKLRLETELSQFSNEIPSEVEANSEIKKIE